MTKGNKNKNTKTDDKKVSFGISDEELKALKIVKEHRFVAETNVISILWKDTEQYFEQDKITIDSFLHNECKVWYQIGYDIVVKEKKTILDEITVNHYLEKHPSLEEKYDEYGRFKTIANMTAYAEVKNITGYIDELNKWSAVMQMAKNKFPIAHRIKDYRDMAAEEIYQENEAILNHIFSNVQDSSGGIRTYDLADDLDELIDELDLGLDVGLPFYNLDILSKETNGISPGEFYLFLSPSGAGKSSFMRSQVLTSICKEGEKIVIMINEEDIKKQRKEMLIWVANNIYHKDIQKYKLNKGGYSDELKRFLKNECANWIREHKQQIIVVAFDRFETSKAIKIIKKYSAMGVKHFVLDTFKHDASMASDSVGWLDLQLNSVALYDTIKPAGCNVSLICTMQLNKASTKQRYYTMDNISGAKNVIDVVSTCIMMRWMLPDEFKGEKRELKVFQLIGKSGKSKKEVTLDKNKRYQILFLPKNRFGMTDEYQIVLEVDLSRNIYKEIGLCCVTPDF